MTTNPPRKPLPPGHVLFTAAAISGLSIVLAAGLGALGFLKRANAMIAVAVSRNGVETFPNHLSEHWIWLAGIAFSFGVAMAILGTPGWVRRMILCITSLVLVGTWAPVLSLAAHSPDIAAPWIATLWSCLCAMIYAANHRMPTDEPPSNLE